MFDSFRIHLGANFFQFAGAGMEPFFRGLAVLAALLGAGTAQAADLQKAPVYTKAPPAPVEVFNWTGFYVGVNVGYSAGSGRVNGLAGSSDLNGIIGGGQIGYNWQGIGSPWVFGVEADVQGSSADDTFAPWKFSNPWFGTVRGRGGYAFSNLLVYCTLGLSFGELRANTFGLSESHTNIGWTAGVGAEFGFARNWSAKIEYLYVDLANSNFVITGASHGLSFGTVWAGVNYRFSAQ